MKTIYISAGESSGDLLGADLARALLKKDPTLSLTGMCGERMRNAGVSSIIDAEKLYVMGFFEILAYLPTLFSILSNTKKYLQLTKPALVILIDFSSWHFRIMKIAKKLGIPVLFYVSPKVWASRPNRINILKKYVDHMAVLFSFEEKVYKDAGIPVTFVGHPLGELVKPNITAEAAYSFFQLDAKHPIIVLFPGSRRIELKKNLTTLIESAQKIQQQKPGTQCILFLANHFDENDMRKKLPSNIKIIKNNLYDLLQITTAAVAVSGTVTLEIALMQVPLCIIYKTNPLTLWISKKIILIKHIGLCNILAQKLIAKEFIQDDANSEAISAEIVKLMDDKNYYQTMQNELKELKKHVLIPDRHSSDIVADIALKMAGN